MLIPFEQADCEGVHLEAAAGTRQGWWQRDAKAMLARYSGVVFVFPWCSLGILLVFSACLPLTPTGQSSLGGERTHPGTALGKRPARADQPLHIRDGLHGEEVTRASPERVRHPCRAASRLQQFASQQAVWKGGR